MLFSELCYEWLEFKKCSVKVTTMSTYMRTLERYIVVKLGDRNCDELKEVDMINYINELSTMNLSKKSIQDIVVILKSIVKYGNISGKLNIKLELIPCPRVPHKKTEVLTNEEVNHMLHYMKDHPSYKNIGIYIELYTGMRLGEISALTWEDIDIRRHRIHVNKTMQRIYVDEGTTKVVVTTPKTDHSIREIPISDTLSHILHHNYHHNGYVLTNTSQYIEPRTLQKYFNQLTQNLYFKNTNFHILRHTFATHCIECEVDIKSLSEILGHSSVNITLNRYVQSSFDTKEKQIKKLSY